MKDILTIIKKELTRFFTDYRMLGAMIIPGILIYVILWLGATIYFKGELDELVYYFWK